MEGLLAQVLEELGQHLDDADRHAADYARAYVASIVDGGKTPHTSTLHPCLARLVRELALDADVSCRRWRMVA